MGSPTKTKAPGNDLASMLSGLFQNALTSGRTTQFGPGDLGSFVQNAFQLPAYQGSVAAPLNPAQTTTMQALTSLFGGTPSNEGQGTLGPIGRIADASTLSGQPAAQTTFQLPGTTTLSGASAGALQPQATLAQLASTQPDFFANLGNALQTQSQAANPAISGLLNFGTGPGTLDAAGNALRTQANIGLQQGLGDIREQFSGLGLRNSTNLAQADSNLIAQSAANTGAQLAQLYPTLTGQQIQALTSGGGLATQQAGQAGNLAAQAAGLGIQNQGNQANILSTILGSQTGAGSTLAQLAASIYGTQQGNATQAALALPNAYNTLSMLPYNQGATLFGLGSQAQGATQQGLMNQYQQYLNQNAFINAIPSLITGVPAPTVSAGGFNNVASGIGAMKGG